MQTPKERFLKLFYVALQNFEDETGVEIHSIKVNRQSIEDFGAINKTEILNYDLELK